jgi:rubrerythrin
MFELIPLLAGATTASKNIVDLVRAAKIKLKGNKDAETALSEIQRAVSDLQSSLLTLQTEALSLQAEIGQQREQIRTYEERTTEKDKYGTKQLREHLVMVLKGQKGPPFWCHSCFMRGDYSQLVRQHVSFYEIKGSYACPKCGAPYHI